MEERFLYVSNKIEQNYERLTKNRTSPQNRTKLQAQNVKSGS